LCLHIEVLVIIRFVDSYVVRSMRNRVPGLGNATAVFSARDSDKVGIH
jgi:hypothetical protein